MDKKNEKDEKKIIVIGKKSSRKKYLLILTLLILLCIGILMLYVYFTSEDSNENKISPTPFPTVTIRATVSPTPKEIGISPTPTETTTTGQKYIFPDCEIELLADTQWIPSSKGYLGTCGILSTVEISEFTDLTEYEGTLIAILPFLSNSPFAPVKQNNYEEYMDKMNKEATRYSPTRDFLYSREEYQVNYRPAVIAEIYNAQLGMTKQVFYTGSRGEYIILWGGQTSETFEEDVIDVINTISFRQALPGDE